MSNEFEVTIESRAVRTVKFKSESVEAATEDVMSRPEHYLDGVEHVVRVLEVRRVGGAVEKPTLVDPCPNPYRKGIHELYMMHGSTVCKACGATQDH